MPPCRCPVAAAGQSVFGTRSYAERKAKREAEIEGLKEALQVLSETALLQVKSSLRGVRRAL